MIDLIDLDDKVDWKELQIITDNKEDAQKFVNMTYREILMELMPIVIRKIDKLEEATQVMAAAMTGMSFAEYKMDN